jgi:RNA-directed DNA polymerase
LEGVLSNKGARTAGIDGLTKKVLASQEAKAAFIQGLRKELREKSFRPTPGRRIYIPKSNGKTRPLGILTLKDRVVQMLLKMLLEPIWESDFLNCSNGFRAGRRTMDWIALLDSYINNQSKFYWVIEGDIKGAFDNIHQGKLLSCLAKRIAEGHILNLIERILKVGVMENQLFKRTDLGRQQGGIISPLLANIYLHQMDLFWWNKYGSLDRKAKERRRLARMGNCSLIRFADDWLLLINGSKMESYRLKEEMQTFLKEELGLELSEEKTHITHANHGFDFFCFHIKRYTSRDDRPKMLVTANNKSKERLKTKVKEMTARKRFRDKPLLKFSALNGVLRGWIGYYQHCNAKERAKDLDFWVNERLHRWLQRRHKLAIRRTMQLYKRRQKGERYNLGIENGVKLLYLYKMSDQPITKYRSRKPMNPYITGEWVYKAETTDTRIGERVWLGNAKNNERWREIKAEIKAEQGARCETCESTYKLEVHHMKARCQGGKDTKENAQLLCKRCHVKTPTYGSRRWIQ